MMKKSSSEIEQATTPFRLGALQDYVTIHRHLERHGIGFEQIRAYLKKRTQHAKKNAKQHRTQVRTWRQHGPKCPDCGTILTLRDGDDNDCHLTCYKCRWGKYVPMPAKKVWEEVIRKKEVKKNG